MSKSFYSNRKVLTFARTELTPAKWRRGTFDPCPYDAGAQASPRSPQGLLAVRAGCATKGLKHGGVILFPRLRRQPHGAEDRGPTERAARRGWAPAPFRRPLARRPSPPAVKCAHPADMPYSPQRCWVAPFSACLSHVGSWCSFSAIRRYLSLVLPDGHQMGNCSQRLRPASARTRAHGHGPVSAPTTMALQRNTP